MSQGSEDIHLVSPHGDLKFLCGRRKYVRLRITKAISKVETQISSLSNTEKKAQLEKLRDLKSDVEKLDEQIFSLHVSEDKSDRELQKFCEENDAYEEKLSKAIASLSTDATEPGGNVPGVAPNKLKLPEIPLPTFANGKDESLENFLHSFESITLKHNLTSYEKFVYLRSHLSKSPRTLIDSLDIKDQVYEKAKELLETAFASPLTQKYELINKLAKLKLSYNDDPYNYIGDMRTISNSFKTLKIDVDLILQYFFWNGLNDRFQNHLIQITNNCKPTLKEMEDKIFEATERYQRQNEKAKEYKDKYVKTKSMESKVTSASLATHVQDGKYNSWKNHCMLCKSDEKNAEHAMSACTKYPQAEDKCKKLQSLKACCKCTLTSHETKSCRYKFNSKCRFCRGYHFSYLCTSQAKEHKGKPEKDERKAPEKTNKTNTTNGMVSVEVFKITNNNSVLLPTFTCESIGEASRKRARVLRDCGSQRNFIEDSLARKLGCKILEKKVELIIHGINTSKSLMVNWVEVNLRINDKISTIQALTIPQIRTELKLEGLEEVIQTFILKGYELADKDMMESPSNIINNIGILLGEDGDHVLDSSRIKFGGPIPSTYLETPLGAMLTGNIARITQNLPELPSKRKEESNVLTEHSQVKPKAHEDDKGDKVIYRNLLTKNKSCQDILIDNKDLFTEDNKPSSTETRMDIETTDGSISSLLNKKGEITQAKLEKAANQVLEKEYAQLTDQENLNSSEEETETNLKLISYVLNQTERAEDGRLIMPLMWNSKIKHLLAKNFKISTQILHSNLKKLQKNPEKLKMVEEVFREQEEMGIIQRIENLEEFMEVHPECSFLPHMPIFKLDRESTKCRNVFLSNLCEKNGSNPDAVSNNQAMMAGPNLNHKITTNIMLLRFDKYLLLFDLKKAFLNIALRESDQNRLLFLWFKNIEKGDFSLIAYQNLRLSFGLRASPSILMLALFKILVLDAENEEEELKEMKESVYNLIYMDNGGYSCNKQETLKWAYKEIPKAFEKYRFSLQQFLTNDLKLQEEIDQDLEVETPSQAKLFGMIWDREADSIGPVAIHLDATANTKRLILSTIKSVYDVFNLLSPVMNRSNLFLQKLMLDKSLDWDTHLPEDMQQEWTNIVKQANSAGRISIGRVVGEREDSYRLIAFTDSSKDIYGTVIYIQNLKNLEVNLLITKNRLVGGALEKKTIPTLEFLGICLGVETLLEIFQELTGPKTLKPIKIVSLELFTDSMVSLHWLQSYACKYDKMMKRGVFILNRLRAIDEMCRIHPVNFRFIEGANNPADYVTRSISYKQLMKTNYLQGPKFLQTNRELDDSADITVTVPSAFSRKVDEVPETVILTSKTESSKEVQKIEHLIPLNRYSRATKLFRTYRNVLRFINNIKIRINMKKGAERWKTQADEDLYQEACNQVIRREQHIHYAEIFQYFNNQKALVRDIPNLVTQLNLVLSKESILKVKSKFGRGTEQSNRFPILLPKHSDLTKLIIYDLHIQSSHAGTYTLLRELRKKFWITHYYSTVRQVLRGCTLCRRLNERPVALNQNSYKEFRLNPPEIPFRYVFIDYMGPYTVTWNGERRKVWVLLITCLWSRAINMKICNSADTKDFLRAIQLHVYEYGLFQLCVSDLGSQITAGVNIISSMLDEYETQNYLQENGINHLKYEQFSKGNSALGSLIEVCVKLTKKLVYGTIKNTVLDYFEFQFVIHKTTHLVNRRPIAFKDSLRDCEETEDVEAITPEILLKGYELVSLNIIPELQISPNEDPDWINGNNPASTVKGNWDKLKKCRERLIDLYHAEFVTTLVQQATDKKSRYKPVTHKKLQKGDVVLLREKHLKPSTYPLAIVKEVQVNSLGETTAAKVMKGKTRETVYRHATSIIKLLSREDPNPKPESNEESEDEIDGKSESNEEFEDETNYRPESNEESIDETYESLTQDDRIGRPTEQSIRKINIRKAAVASGDKWKKLIASQQL